MRRRRWLALCVRSLSAGSGREVAAAQWVRLLAGPHASRAANTTLPSLGRTGGAGSTPYTAGRASACWLWCWCPDAAGGWGASSERLAKWCWCPDAEGLLGRQVGAPGQVQPAAAHRRGAGLGGHLRGRVVAPHRLVNRGGRAPRGRRWRRRPRARTRAAECRARARAAAIGAAVGPPHRSRGACERGPGRLALRGRARDGVHLEAPCIRAQADALRRPTAADLTLHKTAGCTGGFARPGVRPVGRVLHGARGCGECALQDGGSTCTCHFASGAIACPPSGLSRGLCTSERFSSGWGQARLGVHDMHRARWRS